MRTCLELGKETKAIMNCINCRLKHFPRHLASFPSRPRLLELYFQVQLMKRLCSRRCSSPLKAHLARPSRGQMISLPMGSSHSQKAVWAALPHGCVQDLCLTSQARPMGLETACSLLKRISHQQNGLKFFHVPSRKQVAMTVGSSLPLRSVTSCANSSESKYRMPWA